MAAGRSTAYRVAQFWHQNGFVEDRVNLEGLRARGVLFYTREVAAIVYDVCSRLNNAEEEGRPLEAPTLSQLWITHDGELIMDAGPAMPSADPMPMLASLVERLLPPTLLDQPDYAVPSSFRLLAPRARGFPPGLPPITHPGDLAAAVNRYRGASSTSILQGLFTRTADRATAAAPQSEDDPAPLRLPESPPDVAAASAAADSLDDLWLRMPAPNDPRELDLRADFTPIAASRDVMVPRPRRRAVAWALGATLMLLAFGVSYQITRHVVSQGSRVAHADEGSPARESPAPSPPPDVDVLPTAPLDIPRSAGPVFSPSFAASGSLLAFHAGRDPTARLMLGRLHGNTAPLDVVTIVDGPARNYHPRLSPDGRYLAFDSDRDGVRGVYVANGDGRDAHRISGPGFAAVPTWAPNMRWLAFVRGEPEHPHVWNLWLHDLLTGTERRLTAYRYGQTWGGSWFPDSHRLCYSHEDRLVILDIDSRHTRAFNSPESEHMVRTPAVSPDGRRIAFQVTSSGVWLLDLQSGAMRRIIDDATAEEFAWDPDGRHLAYHSRRSGAWRIWLAAIPD